MASMLAIGCVEENSIQEVKSANSPSTGVTQSKSISTPTPPPQKGTYNNPASVGEIIVLISSGKTFEVSATEVIRGKVLNDAIALENQFNDKPQSGYDYAAVKVQIKYSAGEGSESYLGSPFSAFSEGIELDDPRVVTPKKYPELSTGEFMPGAIKTGWVFFTVPQNKDVLIRFKPNPFIDNTCYINIGST